MSEKMEQEVQRKRRRPSPLLMLTEPPRAMWDLLACAATAMPLANAAQGDGHPVLVLPGFMTTDASTTILRRFLKGRGYRVYGWDLGRNTGPRKGLRSDIHARIEHILESNDGRKISLIGQSLGGIYARVIAVQKPEVVRQVITLGAPFAGWRSMTPPVSRMFEYMSGITLKKEALPRRVVRDFTSDPLAPCTAFYSKLDGIAHWRSCIYKHDGERADVQKENIEVFCSHSGMGVHPAVLYATANRLAQPEDDWRPFRETMPAMARLFGYPEAEPVAS